MNVSVTEGSDRALPGFAGRYIAALLFVLAPVQAMAQGFAGLGTEVEGFARPAPDPVFDFPTDRL